MRRFFHLALLASAASTVFGAPAQGQDAFAEPTYADLADLADSAGIVLRAEVRKQAELEPERAIGVSPGHARIYIEARTSSLISGTAPVGESLRYLVDVPLDSRGKVPKLKKKEVLLFARIGRGRPGEIQLVEADAQLLWTDERERRTRAILSQLVAADAPPAITGIRDALSIAGNLSGESETQLFLSTENDGPVSLTVIRRPGQAPVWGVSWSEIVDQAAQPPQRGTLEWYRLACFLPATIPASAHLSSDPDSRRRAQADYRFVLDELGTCPRNR